MVALPPGQWALVCVCSGFVAATLLNIPMRVQPEGYLPAYVAAGGLTHRDPTEVSGRLAVLTHEVGGTLAALPYGLLVLVLSVAPLGGSLNGVPTVPHLLGVTVLTAGIVLVFSRVALPRFGGRLRQDHGEITRQWALSSFIYGVTLALVVPVMATLLVG